MNIKKGILVVVRKQVPVFEKGFGDGKEPIGYVNDFSLAITNKKVPEYGGGCQRIPLIKVDGDDQRLTPEDALNKNLPKILFGLYETLERMTEREISVDTGMREAAENA